MYCCAFCIGDFFLTKEIRAFSELSGDCELCGTSSTNLVLPKSLRNRFESFLDIYAQAENGKTLAQWLRSDWQIFENLSEKKADELISLILEDSELKISTFDPITPTSGYTREQWEEFRSELKYRNRYFPRGGPDLIQLGEFLKYLVAFEGDLPPVLYRARVQDGKEIFSPDQMGKPQKEMSTHGRANPAGIPYLYLATDEVTAISEVRPQKGDGICVAKFEMPSGLRIADLRNPREKLSPFIITQDQLGILRQVIGFLIQLGKELTIPVAQKSAHLEYLPSQYLCEYIKNIGFSGVMYQSSFGNGINFAFFEDSGFKAKEIRRFKIAKVELQIEAG